jgi:hypothetical protein
MSLLLALCLVGADSFCYRPAFLELSGFGRQTGMGGIGTAATDDPAGIFGNPAAVGRQGLALGLTDWLLETRLVSAAGAVEFGRRATLGAGVNYLAYGDIARWDEQGNLLGRFSSYSLSAKLAGALRITRYLSVGAGLGYVGEKIDGFAPAALAGDIGLRAHWPRFGAGVAVGEFMGASLAVRKALGLYARPLEPLLVAAQVEHTDRIRIRAGAEFRLLDAALRAGYDGQNPCFGAGLRLHGVTLDYAVVLHRQLGLAHQLTLGLVR